MKNSYGWSSSIHLAKRSSEWEGACVFCLVGSLGMASEGGRSNALSAYALFHLLTESPFPSLLSFILLVLSPLRQSLFFPFPSMHLNATSPHHHLTFFHSPSASGKHISSNSTPSSHFFPPSSPELNETFP